MSYNDIGVLDNGTVVTVGDYGYAAIAYDGIIHLIEEESLVLLHLYLFLNRILKIKSFY